MLEHVESPQEFLALIHRKLRGGGLLVVHVPNQQPLSSLVRRMLSRASEDMPYSLYYPIHINGFTSGSLVSTVEHQPFSDLDVERVHVADALRTPSSWATISASASRRSSPHFKLRSMHCAAQ